MRPTVLLVAVLGATAAGCAMVGSQNRGPWVGQPAEALEAHRYFKALPMIRTTTADGVEVRNYQRRANTHQCYTEGNVTAGQALSQSAYNQIRACTSRTPGCDYVFTLRDGKVVEYAPSARVLDAPDCAASAEHAEAIK